MVEKNNSDNNKILVIIKTGQKQSPSGYPLPSSPPPSSPPQMKSLLILIVISANFFLTSIILKNRLLELFLNLQVLSLSISLQLGRLGLSMTHLPPFPQIFVSCLYCNFWLNQYCMIMEILFTAERLLSFSLVFLLEYICIAMLC